MKKFSIIAIISATFITDAQAISASATSRARPGSITGAVVMKANTSIAAAASANARYSSPVNGNPLSESTMPDGRKLFTDMATGEMFVFDASGALIRYAPNPDDTEIAMLGVSVGTARRACTSIYADGHQALFDEASYECSVPVVAHNWSGIIKKSGEDVFGYVPMGKAIKCNADLFDQIDAMRRTSQWVIPTMVVGGGAIGYGVGYAIDNAAEKKEKARQEAAIKAAADAAAQKQMQADQSKLASHISDLSNLLNDIDIGNISSVELNNDDVKITLKQGAVKKTELTKLKNLISESQTTITNDIPDTVQLEIVQKCWALQTHNLIVTMQGEKTEEQVAAAVNASFWKKLGNWLTGKGVENKGGSGINEVSNPRLYYQLEKMYEYMNSKGKKYVQQYYSNIEYGQRVDKTGSGINAVTATADNLARIVTAQGLQEGASFAAKMRLTVSPAVKIDMPSECQGNTEDPEVFMKIVKGQRAVGQKTVNILSNVNSLIDKIRVSKATATADVSALQEKINEMIISANVALEQARQSISKLDESLTQISELEFVQVSMSDEELKVISGQVSAAEKKSFWDKKGVKGAAIGLGIGAVGGLAYWFAEGASVFCNVGGWEQVKLNKTYSLPSFREFIIKHNWYNK